MDLLSIAKILLVDRTVEIYTDRRNDLEHQEYKNHFGEMGQMIAQIDSYTTFSLLIRDMESNEFKIIGLDRDNEMIKDFLEEILSFS